MPDENLLITELLREYLAFNHMRSTLSVMLAESGAPAVPLDRAELAVLVGVTETAHSAQLCVARRADMLTCRVTTRVLRPA
jgi:lisH domain-containing protein FOPNL